MTMNQPEDVEVVLSPDRHYRFHASVLARSSTLLARLLTERNAANLSSKARNAGIKVRWMIELNRIPDEEHPTGKLEIVPLDTMGEPLHMHTGNGLVLNENGRIRIKAFDYYESIFYAFYNTSIKISGENIGAALADTYEIVRISEYLGCIPIISKPIDVALVKHGQDLFRSIQKSPWAWIDLAMRVKSELIFKEALIHVAGNWRRIKTDRSAMNVLKSWPESVRLLCEKQHGVILSQAMKLELSIASLYPGDMLLPSADIPIKREEYAKDILVWMALTFFRHWFTQRIISKKGSAGPDCGYELYTQLSQAGEAYMDKNVMNQFHNKCPITKKGMNVLDNRLLEIKECIKGIVEAHGILKSNCQLDTNRYPVNYLTCAEMTSDDYPWSEKTLQETTARLGNKKSMRLGGNEITELNMAAARLHAQAMEVGEWDESDESDDDDDDDYGTGQGKRTRYA